MPSKKILLVEDDLDIRENMAMVLEYEGHNVTTADQGQAALAILEGCKEEYPDVILLDLFMPVMNGREFIEALGSCKNERAKKIPVILLTASEQTAHSDLAAKTRAVIRKPIELKGFLNLLNTIS